jgi:glycosyltransferase involved in cell wall biosynthesis
MQILFLTQIVPYPPISGPKIKTWHVLRHLASQGHEILLASFVRPEEEEYIPFLREVCSQVHAIPIRRSRLMDGVSWLRSHLTGRPFLIERDDLPAMRTLVERLLATQNIAAIHADQITMAQFALPAPRFFHRQATAGRSLAAGEARPLRVFDAHNATWTIVERMRATLPGARAILQPLLRVEAGRMKRYEGLIVETFDHTLAVTDIDRQALLEALCAHRGNRGQSRGLVPAEAQISTIPIAVDTEQRQPIRRQPGSMNILTLGTLYYPPNADGIRWFAQEVFPRVQKAVPAATLTIVGKNPPQDFLQMAERSPQSLRVTGYVPDLDPYLENASVVVVPVRAGSGMRVRILEMFAHAMPVVTTTVGLEGIVAEPEKEVLVADTPDEFAAAVVRLLQAPDLQEKLALAGRRLAQARYDWKVALNKLAQIYACTAGSKER